MKCVKCGGQVAFTDLICPHCYYIKEQERYAELRKPLVPDKPGRARRWFMKA